MLALITQHETTRAVVMTSQQARMAPMTQHTTTRSVVARVRSCSTRCAALYVRPTTGAVEKLKTSLHLSGPPHWYQYLCV